MNYFPIFALFCVFALVVVRQIGSYRFQLWHIMLGGALAVLLSGSISPGRAMHYISFDVILFLFGMFVVGEALVESGYLRSISDRFFGGARGSGALIFLVLAVMGFFSAFLMNDTVAVIGAPLVISLSERHGITAKLMLLSLCFSVTIGSVFSPLGNPQNLLVALHGIKGDAFLTFFKYLFPPTVISIFAAYYVLKLFYREEFKKVISNGERAEPADAHLAMLSKASLAVIFLGIFVKICSVVVGAGDAFRLTYIALGAAAPILLFSPKRRRVLLNIDWATLVFFAAMFVLMGSVWDTPLAEKALCGFKSAEAPVPLVMFVSVMVSQVISNVPYVMLSLPAMTAMGASTKSMMALAAGSTLAGNLFILGAASNVIVIQNAEKRGYTVTFVEFAKVGLPLTALSVVIYWAYLSLF